MRNRHFALTALLFLLLSLPWTAGPAHAQDPPPEPTPPDIIIEPPMPPVWNVDDVRVEYQRVNVTIDNQIATTRIDQLFVNDGNGLAEGVYFYPLPEGAAVTDLVMWIDGTPIQSKILGQAEARQIYDEIVRQLRDPALLEYVGSSAVQANVFPIPAGEERRIEIEYQQVLPAENGLFHYVYPQSTDLYTNLPLDEQSIRVEIVSNEAIRTLYSPSHPVADSRDGEFRAVVGYEDTDVTADTDFELYYGVSPEEIGLSLLSYREAGQDGFFLLMAAPSVEIDEQDVVAKDVILVLDTSGSMEGEKLAQSKEAARFIIDNLNGRDRFNIVSFSTGVRAYRSELVSMDDAGHEQFINSLEALGGTNISQALLAAVDQADEQRPTTVIFLTDGLATEGVVETQEIVAQVDAAAPNNVRLFAFGVGDDVDTVLLDTLTQQNRGVTSYVRPFERIDEELNSFYTKISTPVLADVSLDFDGIIVERTYPADLPDLFAGEQLLLVGRYRQPGPATITLRGQVNGEEQTFVYEDNLFRESGGDEFLPRLWATRAIGRLLQQIRLDGETQERVESVVNLSVRYGIITPYTSYLIEEDDIFSQTGRDAIIDEEVAAGEADDSAVFGAEAVEEAETAADLSAAEAPAAAPVAEPRAPSVEGGAAEPAVQTIRVVGDKTFVLRNGVWIDTAFDDSLPREEVRFASDAYFDLLSAVPALGPALSLGEAVTVVADGRVYAVSPEAEAGDVTLPENTAASTSVPTDPAATTGPEPTEVAAVTTPIPMDPTVPQNNSWPIPWPVAAGGTVLLLLAGWVVWRLRH